MRKVLLPPDETAPGGKFSLENFKSWVLSNFDKLDEDVKTAIMNSTQMYNNWVASGGTSIFAEADVAVSAATSKEGEVEVPVDKHLQLQQSAKNTEREREVKDREKRGRDRRDRDSGHGKDRKDRDKRERDRRYKDRRDSGRSKTRHSNRRKPYSN